MLFHQNFLEAFETCKAVITAPPLIRDEVVRLETEPEDCKADTFQLQTEIA